MLSYSFSRIIRLTESGVYQKWLDVAIFGIWKGETKSQLISYKQAKLSHFAGVVYMLGIIVFASLLAFLSENYVSKRENKKRKQQPQKLFTKRSNQLSKSQTLVIQFNQACNVYNFYRVTCRPMSNWKPKGKAVGLRSKSA